MSAEPCGLREFVCTDCGLLYDAYRPTRDECERPRCPSCTRLELERAERNGCDSEVRHD